MEVKGQFYEGHIQVVNLTKGISENFFWSRSFTIFNLFFNRPLCKSINEFSSDFRPTQIVFGLSVTKAHMGIISLGLSFPVCYEFTTVVVPWLSSVQSIHWFQINTHRYNQMKRPLCIYWGPFFFEEEESENLIYTVFVEKLWSPLEATAVYDLNQTLLPRFQYFRCLLNNRGIAAAPVTNFYARRPPIGPGSCFDQ